MRWLVLLSFLAACAQGTLKQDGDGGVDGPTPIDAVDAPIVDAIDASTCATQPCDLYLQCGCEGTAGQVCDLDPTMFTTGGTACRDNLLNGDETLACTRNTSCAGGHSCIGGRCRRFCRTDDDCPGAGGLCIIRPTANGNPIPGVTNCTTDCMPNLATNPSCPATWGCHVYFDDPTPATPTSGDERYLTDCGAPPASGGGVGAACTSHASCQAGLDCVTLNPGGQQCRPNCVCPGGNCAAGTCPAGSGSCRGFMTPVVIGANTFGTCF